MQPSTSTLPAVVNYKLKLLAYIVFVYHAKELLRIQSTVAAQGPADMKAHTTFISILATAAG
jgi:hypothetical protein